METGKNEGEGRKRSYARGGSEDEGKNEEKRREGKGGVRRSGRVNKKGREEDGNW